MNKKNLVTKYVVEILRLQYSKNYIILTETKNLIALSCCLFPSSMGKGDDFCHSTFSFILRRSARLVNWKSIIIKFFCDSPEACQMCGSQPAWSQQRLKLGELQESPTPLSLASSQTILLCSFSNSHCWHDGTRQQSALCPVYINLLYLQLSGTTHPTATSK